LAQSAAVNGISSLMKMELLMQSDVLPYVDNLNAKPAGLLILFKTEFEEKRFVRWSRSKKITMNRQIHQDSSHKWSERPAEFPQLMTPAVLPDDKGGFTPCPEFMTEEELIVFLRISQISNAKNYHNVIDNLKRMHGLPRIRICGKPLYPIEAIRKWIENKTITEK
jgi:hypothetical protein